MSTRSNIAVQNTDGSVVEVYCHFDGYLSNNGDILQRHYATFDKALALVNAGPYSSLGDEPALCKKSASGRIQTYKSVKAFLADGNHQEYTYLFINNEWVVIKGTVAAPLSFALSWGTV